MRRFLVIIAVCCSALATLASGAAASPSGPVVRFTTTLGNMDVQLLPADAPNTVTNFLSYVNSGAYATTFLHRSDSGVGIIQGGSYEVQNGQRTTIPSNAPIGLEYSLPNQRGTLAMARTSDPNSATSGWFFNVTDNSTELGPSNGGGYAVFGRILSPKGLAVMDAIAQQQVVNDSVDGPQYGQLPVVNYASGAISTSNLIMSAVTVLPDESPTVTITFPASGMPFTIGQKIGAASFQCNEDANGTGIASCTATPIDVSTAGPKTFTVTATDYAGNTTTKSVPYVVNAAPPGPKRVAPRPPVLFAAPLATRTGKVVLQLGCSTVARCAGTVTLRWNAPHHRTLRIASGRYRIPGYRAGTAIVHLSRPARKALLRAHRLSVSLQLQPTGGRARTVRTTLRLARH
ncbi:MAG TPA: peptidylprolyl isomerase [Solirubrobacteraceae bacterium]|nr:peptidylprolyl isomerase [Solirubrobacteraceae bacterium]